MATFSGYLEKWLQHLTPQGMNNPLVKMPIKRFRLLSATDVEHLRTKEKFLVGTVEDPISRNLYKNFQTRLRERGEHAAFWTYGSIETVIVAAAGEVQQEKKALFPVFMQKVDLKSDGSKIRVELFEDEKWIINPILAAHLKKFDITLPKEDLALDALVSYLKAQFGNRAEVKQDSFIGLFSSQQMIVRERLADPILRNFLSQNPVVKAKVQGEKVAAEHLGEVTDDGLEDLGMALPGDDSQLRVVQMSDQGYSLQVEGPPGTGKSQTIANIISNALWKGKKVLLVCDKKAAITQVEERLTNCGLGAALLNLHSEDLDKKLFIDQAARHFYKNQKNYTVPFDQLRQTRAVLNDRIRYAREIAHPALQITQREALSGLIRLKRELKSIPEIEIRNWQDMSQERLQKTLRDIATWPTLGDVLTDSNSVWNQVKPEAFDGKPNTPQEIKTLADSLLTEKASIESLKEICAAVGVQCDFFSLDDVKKISRLAKLVLSKPSSFPHIIANINISKNKLTALHTAWKKREEIKDSGHPVDLIKVIPDEGLLALKGMVGEDHGGEAAYKSITWEDLAGEADKKEENLKTLSDSQTEYRDFCNRFGITYEKSLGKRAAQFEIIIELLTLSCPIPKTWWSQEISPIVAFEKWKSCIVQSVKHASRNEYGLNYSALDRVSGRYSPHIEAQAEHGFNLVSYCLHYVDDRKVKIGLKQAYTIIPKKLTTEQWQDLALHATEAINILHDLTTSAEVHVLLKQLTSSFINSPTDSDKWLGQDKVQAIQKLAMLVEQYRTKTDLFDVSCPPWQNLWEIQDGHSSDLLKSYRQRLKSVADILGKSDYIEQSIQSAAEGLSGMKKFIETYQRPGDKAKSIFESISACRTFQEATTFLEDLKHYAVINDSITPDWELLKSTIAWRDEFEILRGNYKLDIDSTLWEQINKASAEHLEKIESGVKRLKGFFSLSPEANIQYSELLEILQGILKGLDVHPHWVQKKKWEQKMLAYPEIQDLWDKVVNGKVNAKHAEKLFIFNFLLACKPIAEPTGADLSQAIDSFGNQDARLESWSVDRLKDALADRFSKAARDFAAQHSEINRLSTMQRPRGTVREILNKHTDFLLASKPCWMLSPTSLANLVDFSVAFKHNSAPFDLVIFDEASQIRVTDGMLSMAFGKQTIIVGDRHQLPPTDFFAACFTDDEESGEDFGISESLLEEYAGVFEEGITHAMLMCHYRSETPDLIRFSNHFFYKDQLEMYPPAHVSGMGKKLHYVPSGIFTKDRTNIQEADHILKLIEAHVKNCPAKSLGIVTMNIPQMELIDEKILTLSSDVRQFCGDENKFFLRNLETVQGDEMDRIILSLTYSKSESGQFSANVLGPLLRSGGERRLNVAITRSRSGLAVVTSLNSADLATSNAQSRGFKCLKDFITDLEAGSQLSTFGMDSKRFAKHSNGISNVVYCESPFEEEVVTFLENSGFEIECQYGCGGFRIDIVVKERGKNLLAIECDGKAYHESLVARTRDRARQRLLEQRGWLFHRVWSTNWWNFEEHEKAAILSAIQKARERNKN